MKILNDKTLQYYQNHAAEYTNSTLTADMSMNRNRFTERLPENAYVLDFGCGSGRDTKVFLDLGFQVDAIDGSEELCKIASDFTGIQVKHMLFQELEDENKYDGIWACASILHLPKDELLLVFNRIATALKEGGILYTCFKKGTFEGVRDGRYFSYFTESALMEYWKNVPALQITDTWITRDVRPSREEEQWINLLAKQQS